MKTTTTVTDRDFRQAKFIVNNVKYIANKNSMIAALITKNAKQVIALYNAQQKGLPLSAELSNPANIIGMFKQYAQMIIDTKSANVAGDAAKADAVKYSREITEGFLPEHNTHVGYPVHKPRGKMLIGMEIFAANARAQVR